MFTYSLSVCVRETETEKKCAYLQYSFEDKPTRLSINSLSAVLPSYSFSRSVCHSGVSWGTLYQFFKQLSLAPPLTCGFSVCLLCGAMWGRPTLTEINTQRWWGDGGLAGLPAQCWLIQLQKKWVSDQNCCCFSLVDQHKIYTERKRYCLAGPYLLLDVGII